MIKRISTDVLRMNFMKRTTVQMERKEKMQQQQKASELIATGKAVVEPPRFYPVVEHIDDDPNWTLGGVMSEWRYTMLQNQRFGRFSFNGQNPEVEKWMIFHERRRLGLADPEEEDGQKGGDERGESDDEREDGELLCSDEEEAGSQQQLKRRSAGDEEPVDLGRGPAKKKFRFRSSHGGNVETKSDWQGRAGKGESTSAGTANCGENWRKQANNGNANVRYQRHHNAKSAAGNRRSFREVNNQRGKTAKRQQNNGAMDGGITISSQNNHMKREAM